MFAFVVNAVNIKLSMLMVSLVGCRHEVERAGRDRPGDLH
jgi:hypothetical protein